MGAFSSYLEDAIQNHVLGNVQLPSFANVYIALFHTAPTEAGQTAYECTGNGYARVALVNDATNWGNSTDGRKTNQNAITFPTATGSWGGSDQVVSVGIYTMASGGNLLYFGLLSAPKTVANGDTVSIGAGQLEITID